MTSIDLLDAALEIQGFRDAHGCRSCFIGGIAAQRRSQAHVTRDIEKQLIPVAEAKEEPEILRQLARIRHLSETL